MPYTHDWFSGNIPNWQKHLGPLEGKELQCLEIGCYEGMATVWMLENILTNPKSTMEVIDTFEGSIEHHDRNLSFSKVYDNFVENTKAHAQKLVINKGMSQEVLVQPNFVGKKFDVIYIDGSHQAPDVLMDAVLTWPMLKVGGVMIFDDYGWKAYPDERFNPGIAIDAFINVFGNTLELIHDGYQRMVRKTKDHQ